MLLRLCRCRLNVPVRPCAELLRVARGGVRSGRLLLRRAPATGPCWQFVCTANPAAPAALHLPAHPPQGKELIEDLTVLRFANLVFEPLWSRQYIRNVQVCVPRARGAGRGAGGACDGRASRQPAATTAEQAAVVRCGHCRVSRLQVERWGMP